MTPGSLTSQPQPTPGRQGVSPHAARIFQQVLEAQNAKGRAKYRTGLQTHNGRDALWDAIEEAVDHFQYLVQAWLEFGDLERENRHLKAQLEATVAPLSPTPDAGPPSPVSKTDDPRPFLLNESSPAPMLPDSYRPLMHVNGEKPCHAPAMFLTRLLRYGEPADLSLLRILPDLREPTPLDPPLCGSCGREVDPYTQRDLDWRPHFIPKDRPMRSAPPDPLPSEPNPAPSEVGLASEESSRRAAEEPYPSDAEPAASTTPVDPPNLEEVEALAKFWDGEPLYLHHPIQGGPRAEEAQAGDPGPAAEG